MLTKTTKLQPTFRPGSTPIKSDVGSTRLDVQPSSTPTTLAQAKITNVHEPNEGWLASGCTTVLIALAKSISVSVHSNIWVKPMLSGFIGYVLADLVSGVYHWGIDNYGDANNPIFGAQIEGFQGHHEKPWIITRHQIANNLHVLAQAITFLFLPIHLIYNDLNLMALVGSFSGCILFSQQFHAWSHSTKHKLPPIVVTLQDLGVLVSRTQHAAHHRSPYNSRYCIVSGIRNKILDENKILEALEMVIFFQFGVRPRSWNEPSFKFTQENSAPSPYPQ